MGLKAGGVRGSLRNVSTGVGIPDSGVSRWLFEQNLNDDWDGNDGVANNGAAYVTDSAEGSYALDFDGVDDYVDLGYASNISDSALASGYSLFSHVKLRATPTDENNFILEMHSSSGNDPVGLSWWGFSAGGGPGLGLYHDDGGNRILVPSNSFNLNTWYFLAARYDGSTAECRLYDLSKNVVDSASRSATDLPTVGSNPFWNCGGESNALDGILDGPGIGDGPIAWSDLEALI